MEFVGTDVVWHQSLIVTDLFIATIYGLEELVLPEKEYRKLSNSIVNYKVRRTFANLQSLYKSV